MSKGISGNFQGTVGQQRAIDRLGITEKLGATGEEKERLIKTVEDRGDRISREKIIWITEDDEKNVIWLEDGKVGDNGTGFEHILAHHKNDYKKLGIDANEIPAVILDAVMNGEKIGERESGNLTQTYKVSKNGNDLKIKVVIGSNGYIVTAYPV